MSNSKTLTTTSRSEVQQLPLKGFRVKLETEHKNREVYVEGMGDGRFRIHMSAKRAK